MGLQLNDGLYTPVVACAVGVTNLDEAIAWYKDVLGFELIYKMDDVGWAELKTPNKDLVLGLSVKEKVEVGGGAVVTWGVTDIEKAKKGLEPHNVKFDGDIMVVPDMVKLLTFFDPYGNTFMMAQDLANP